MLDVKTNYGNRNHINLFCPLCHDPTSTDTQQQLLHCVSLADNSVVQGVPQYEDLFSKYVNKLIQIAIVMEENYLKRKHLLQQRK